MNKVEWMQEFDDELKLICRSWHDLPATTAHEEFCKWNYCHYGKNKGLLHYSRWHSPKFVAHQFLKIIR